MRRAACSVQRATRKIWRIEDSQNEYASARERMAIQACWSIRIAGAVVAAFTLYTRLACGRAGRRSGSGVASRRPPSTAVNRRRLGSPRLSKPASKPARGWAQELRTDERCAAAPLSAAAATTRGPEVDAATAARGEGSTPPNESMKNTAPVATASIEERFWGQRRTSASGEAENE